MHGLMLIISTEHVALNTIYDIASQAILGGINSLQLRHKGPYTKEVYGLAEKLKGLCFQSNIAMIVNDRFDIALGVDAAGVHLGQTDVPFSKARFILGSKMVIGRTASSVVEAKRAEQEGANYIGFGHIFHTSTKFKGYPPVGLKKLEEVCQKIKLPILAVGGINESNLNKVLKTGVQGIAVASNICEASNPFKQTQILKRIISDFGVDCGKAF